MIVSAARLMLLEASDRFRDWPPVSSVPGPTKGRAAANLVNFA